MTDFLQDKKRQITDRLRGAASRWWMSSAGSRLPWRPWRVPIGSAASEAGCDLPSRP